MIPCDIERYVARKFSNDEQLTVLTLLETATLHDGTPANARLLRCAVISSRGSVERLRMQIDTLKHDYRDVIVEGEYSPVKTQLVRVRNLEESIPDDSTY